MNFIDIFRIIRVSDVVDITIMSILIYAVLVLFQKSKAGFVLIGIFIVGAIYLITLKFHLYLTTAVFQAFFTVFLIALIIIFQEEIKHFFERLAVWSLSPRTTRQKIIQFGQKEVEILNRTLTDLSRDRIGAIVVVRGKDIIVRHLDGGIDLNGELSEPILKSLFDPHSDGHDGAVIVEGNTITQFSTHLPLSKDLKKIGRSGTRHAAALGLSELSDALCLVVSEEQGTISVAQNGEIEIVSDPEKLNLILKRFYEDVYPTPGNTWHNFLARNAREKVLAVLITIILWYVFAYQNLLRSSGNN